MPWKRHQCVRGWHSDLPPVSTADESILWSNPGLTLRSRQDIVQSKAKIHLQVLRSTSKKKSSVVKYKTQQREIGRVTLRILECGIWNVTALNVGCLVWRSSVRYRERTTTFVIKCFYDPCPSHWRHTVHNMRGICFTRCSPFLRPLVCLSICIGLTSDYNAHILRGCVDITFSPCLHWQDSRWQLDNHNNSVSPDLHQDSVRCVRCSS